MGRAGLGPRRPPGRSTPASPWSRREWRGGIGPTHPSRRPRRAGSTNSPRRRPRRGGWACGPIASQWRHGNGARAIARVLGRRRAEATPLRSSRNWQHGCDREPSDALDQAKLRSEEVGKGDLQARRQFATGAGGRLAGPERELITHSLLQTGQRKGPLGVRAGKPEGEQHARQPVLGRVPDGCPVAVAVWLRRECEIGLIAVMYEWAELGDIELDVRGRRGDV